MTFFNHNGLENQTTVHLYVSTDLPRLHITSATILNNVWDFRCSGLSAVILEFLPVSCTCLRLWGHHVLCSVGCSELPHWHSLKQIHTELHTSTLNMLNCFIDYKRCILYSTEENQILCRATWHVAYPKHVLSIPCLLMPSWLKSPGHQQAWYWPNMPEYIYHQVS